MQNPLWHRFITTIWIFVLSLTSKEMRKGNPPCARSTFRVVRANFLGICDVTKVTLSLCPATADTNLVVSKHMESSTGCSPDEAMIYLFFSLMQNKNLNLSNVIMSFKRMHEVISNFE